MGLLCVWANLHGDTLNTFKNIEKWTTITNTMWSLNSADVMSYVTAMYCVAESQSSRGVSMLASWPPSTLYLTGASPMANSDYSGDMLPLFVWRNTSTWPSLSYCTFTLAKDVGCKINFRTTEDHAGKSKAWRFFDLVIKFDSVTE